MYGLNSYIKRTNYTDQNLIIIDINVMSNIRIIPVTTRKGLRAFVNFYYELYKGNKFAVPFLRFDEMNTLKKRKNPAFEFCEAQYFLAVDGEARIVGRVAAIINRRANEQWNKKQVRFGWFDFVDDLEVSQALLNAVEAWGRTKGMTECVGPLGFTDMDREGLLIEGFHHKSTMYINYNYPYYKNHMEAMSFYEKDNDWLEYRIKVPEETPAKFARTAEMIEKRYNLHVHKFTSRELVKGGMGREVFHIVNETYKDLYDFQQLTDSQIDKYVNDYIKKADLNLVTGVVDGNDGNRLIGFGVSFPSFTDALQKIGNGKLLPWGWLKILKVLKFHATDTVDLLLIGVLPEYRAKGANALIFADLIQQYHRYGFKWAEAMPQMESNKGVQSQWQYLESEQHRRRRCYRKVMVR